MRVEPDEKTNLLNKVTVVVVTYESAHCITALPALLNECQNSIIVDNGSLDKTVSLAERLLPNTRIVSLNKNIGFGAANNKALDQIQTPYAFLMNPDCETTVESLCELIESAEAFPDAAVIAPQIVNAKGIPDLNYRWPANLWKSRGPGAAAPACVGFVSGAAMLLRVNRTDPPIRFDERFFLYYEDDDLCLRIFEQNIPIIVVPTVHVTHRSRGSVRGKSQLQAEFWRGFHHAQSKLRFTELHSKANSATGLRLKTLGLAMATWPLRLFLFSPRMLARVTGRIAGLISWRPK